MVNNPGGGVADASTYQAGDVINGGAGIDTLNLTIANDNNGIGIVELNSVENVVVKAVDGYSNDIDATNWSGVQKITQVKALANEGIWVVGLQNGITYAVEDSTKNGSWGGFETDDDVLGSKTYTQAYEVSNVGNKSNAFDLDGYNNGADITTKVTIKATGANFVELGNGNGTNGWGQRLESVTVTGAGSLTLSADGNEFNDLKTFDASANAGGVEVDLSAATTDLLTVKGGSGNDTITVNGTKKDATIALGAGNDILIAGANDLDDVASVDGGDGIDTITLDALSLSIASKVSNFEVADLAGADGTIDVSLFTKNTFQSIAATGAVGAGGVVVQNLAGTALNFDVYASTTNNITATLKDSAGTADTLSIKFDADSTGYTVAKLTTTGIETATIESNGDETGTNVVSNLTLNSNNLTTLTITGANDFTLTAIETNKTATATATTTTASALTLIDGSAATGDLTITAGANHTSGTNVTTKYDGLTIKTGSGDDVITIAAVSGKVEAGSGADLINVAALGQTINVGVDEDADIVDLGDDSVTGFADSGSFTTSTKFTTVSNLAKGDSIDLDQFTAGSTVIDYTTASKAFNSLVDAVNGAIAAGTNGDISAFEWADGNTYIVVEGSNGYDTVVKLIGVGYDITAASGVISFA